SWTPWPSGSKRSSPRRGDRKVAHLSAPRGSRRVWHCHGRPAGRPYKRSASSRLRLGAREFHAAEGGRSFRGGGLLRGRGEFREAFPGGQGLGVASELRQQQREIEVGVGVVGLRLHGATVLGHGEVHVLLVLGGEGKIVPSLSESRVPGD